MTAMTIDRKGAADAARSLELPEEFMDALIEQYRSGEVELTAASRLTVEAGRPSSLAISRMLCPAAKPSMMTSRSSILNLAFDTF